MFITPSYIRVIASFFVVKRVSNSLKADRCLGLVKLFKIFHFNWNFQPFLIISILLPSIAMKRWIFSSYFDFKGKIMATFLVKVLFSQIKQYSSSSILLSFSFFLFFNQLVIHFLSLDEGIFEMKLIFILTNATFENAVMKVK